MILDCANCINRHGQPDDYRFFTFAKPKSNESVFKFCPECGSVEPIENKICSVCGYIFSLEKQQSLSTKCNKKQIERLVLIRNAQEDVLNELRKLVKERNYKKGYAFWVFKDLLINAKKQNTGLVFYKKIMNRIKKCREKKYKIAWLLYQ